MRGAFALRVASASDFPHCDAMRMLHTSRQLRLQGFACACQCDSRLRPVLVCRCCTGWHLVARAWDSHSAEAQHNTTRREAKRKAHCSASVWPFVRWPTTYFTHMRISSSSPSVRQSAHLHTAPCTQSLSSFSSLRKIPPSLPPLSSKRASTAQSDGMPCSHAKTPPNPNPNPLSLSKLPDTHPFHIFKPVNDTRLPSQSRVSSLSSSRQRPHTSHERPPLGRLSPSSATSSQFSSTSTNPTARRPPPARPARPGPHPRKSQP